MRTRLLPLLAGAAVAGLLVTFAVLRWGGELPWGSDNDEYLQAASRLADLESPRVAGVEGTKYPLGYPLLLAVFEWLRLPVIGTALVVNGLAVGGVAGLAALTSARLGLGVAGAVAAAGYVAANSALWGAAYWVMPDVLLTLTVAGFLWLVVSGRSGLGAVVAAAALKTVGVVVGVAAGVGRLVRRRDPVGRGVLPAVMAVVVTGGMFLATAGLPSHTTGYTESFWLEDVYDASKGEAGLGGVVARLWDNAGDVFRDVGWAVGSPELGVGVAQIVAVVMVALAVAAFRRMWPTVLAFVALYLAVVLVWPFESLRFGLPLVPLAAAGVALVVSTVGRALSAPLAGAVAVVGVGLFALWTGPDVRTTADLQGAELAAIHESMEAFEEWAAENIAPGEEIVSLDYRELSRALDDRRVLPVGYTADPESLFEQTVGAGADWFVIVQAGFHSRRIPVARLLLHEHGERFQLEYQQGRIEAYSIRP